MIFLSGIKICPDFSSVLSQSTRLIDGQTEGQTDRILTAGLSLHSMHRGSNRQPYIRMCLQTESTEL